MTRRRVTIAAGVTAATWLANLGLAHVAVASGCASAFVAPRGGTDWVALLIMVAFLLTRVGAALFTCTLLGRIAVYALDRNAVD